MRWIFRILAIVVVLVVMAFGLVFLLPAEKIGDLASAQLEKATGRKLTLSGEFKPTIYPVLGVKTGPFTISNADWASEPNMVSAKGASVGVGLSALLGGELDIKRLILDTPVIHLQRDKDGLANWELQTANSNSASDTGSGGSTSSRTSGFSLEKGAITDGVLSYTDESTGQITQVSEINTEFSLPKSGTAKIDGSALLDDRKIDVALSVADLAALMTGDITPVGGSVGIGGLAASLQGQVKMAAGEQPLVNGQYDVSLPDVVSLAKTLGVALPDMVKGLDNLSSKGTIMMSDAGLNLSGDVSVDMNGLPIDTNFEVVGPENWAESLRVDATINAIGRDAFTASWAGLVNGRTSNADGTMAFKASNLPTTLKAFGQSVGFPKGTGQTAQAKGVVRIRDGKNTLSKAVFALDQNVFNGDAELFFDRKPYIAANLSAGVLDFSAFTSEDGDASPSSSGNGGSNSGGASGGWSKEPIRISGLDAINADVNLTAKSINLGVAQLDATKVQARLRDGNLRLTLQDVRAFQGALSGVVSFTGGNAVAFSSDIKANGVQLEPLLGRLLDIRRLTGAGSTTLKMSGTGGSLYQIMHSLSGNGTVRVDRGSFKGVDLAAMMKNLQKAFGGFDGATEFTSLTGTFTMKEGVLQNVDMALLSPLFKATGQGQINVGDRNMSYTVTPTSLSEDAQFSVPVTITGPWSNLKFRPDVGSLIDLLAEKRFEEEKEALKAREDELKAQAEAKILEKLKIKQTEEANKQAVEEATKDNLEDKVKDELGKVLEGLF